MRIEFFTPVKMVGSTNQPSPHSGRVALAPPSAVCTPSDFAMSMYLRTFSSCGRLVTGPTCVSISIGLPIFAVLANATSFSTNWSWIDCCTSRREPAMHVWPVAAKIPEIAPLTALSISASSKTILGDFPPSSMLTRLSPLAAAS